MRYFALIPARGGSKGIPRKNLAYLGNHPLLAWAIAAAQKSGEFEDIVLTSNDHEILDIGRRYGATTLMLRPESISQDDTKQIEVIKHAFQELENIGKKFEHVVLFQPTSPFRPPNLVADAISAHKLSGFCSVISVTNVTYLHDSTLYGGNLNNLRSRESENASRGTLRQTFPKNFWRNGALYVLNRRDVINDSLYSKKIVGVEIVNELAINIDDPLDLEAARNFLETSNGQEIQRYLFESR